MVRRADALQLLAVVVDDLTQVMVGGQGLPPDRQQRLLLWLLLPTGHSEALTVTTTTATVRSRPGSNRKAKYGRS
ncbi:hypothetical protein P3G55_23250, partial [Leptospira sp. 96542]|nr:hypothetical protein [Leptospira sp. 96542]